MNRIQCNRAGEAIDACEFLGSRRNEFKYDYNSIIDGGITRALAIDPKLEEFKGRDALKADAIALIKAHEYYFSHESEIPIGARRQTVADYLCDNPNALRNIVSAISPERNLTTNLTDITADEATWLIKATINTAQELGKPVVLEDLTPEYVTKELSEYRNTNARYERLKSYADETEALKTADI